jgi:hypothetical protein
MFRQATLVDVNHLGNGLLAGLQGRAVSAQRRELAENDNSSAR